MRSSARRALAVGQSFSDDALAYFTERLDPTCTRAALARVLQAKRNKAFETSGGIGLAVDGTTVGRCTSHGCPLCRPHRNADQEIVGYRHHLVLTSVVGTGLFLPCDVEPYGPGDSDSYLGRLTVRPLGKLNLVALGTFWSRKVLAPIFVDEHGHLTLLGTSCRIFCNRLREEHLPLWGGPASP